MPNTYVEREEKKTLETKYHRQVNSMDKVVFKSV